MRFSAILENEIGDSVCMTDSAVTGYMISEIDGLYPPAGTVPSSPYACMNGSYVTNAYIEKRDVVLSFAIRGLNIEKRRQALYDVVKPAQYIKISYITKNTHVYAEGIVETCEIANFSDATSGQISILCADPYWYDVNSVSLTTTTDTAISDFHFVAPSDYQPFPIGVYWEDGAACFKIYNSGEETGFSLDISVTAILMVTKITVTVNSDEFVLDMPQYAVEGYTPPGVIQEGGVFHIRTTAGAKEAYKYDSVGGDADLLAYVTAASTWVTLAHGWNIVAVKLDLFTAGFSTNYTATLSYTPCYLGV